MKLVSGLLFALAATAALAQTPAANDAVFRYRGADREARLVEKAKQEGRLVLYTSLAPTESMPLAEAFEKKYGVKVELWRALSERVVQRAVTEAQGRRHAVDVIETNGPEMEMLAREKLLGEFYSPYQMDLPPNAIPAHRLWFPDRMNFFVVGFNTNKVQRSEIPGYVRGIHGPEVERAHRHRGDRRRVDGDADQDVGRGPRHEFLPRALGNEA